MSDVSVKRQKFSVNIETHWIFNFYFYEFEDFCDYDERRAVDLLRNAMGKGRGVKYFIGFVFM